MKPIPPFRTRRPVAVLLVALSVAATLAGCGGGGGGGGGSTAFEIRDQPTSATVPFGGSATFSVAASGSGLTYRWYRTDSATTVLATTRTYTTSVAGSYYVLVSDAAGDTPLRSDTATLTVTAPGGATVTVN